MGADQFGRHFSREGAHIEFKEGVSKRSIQRTACAFSNTDGGVILLGVRDDGTVIGRSLTKAVESDINAAVLELHDPGKYGYAEIDVEGTPVVVVSVAKRAQGFTQTPDGHVLVRRGERVVPLFGAELTQFLNARTLVHFDTQESGADLSDVDPERLRQISRAFGWRGTHIEQRLQGEGLLADSKNLTVAGALTLLAEPGNVLGKTFIEVLRYPDDGVDYDKREQVTGPAQAQVEQATRYVMEELGRDLVVSGVRRLELPKLPEVVIREAVANAVAHRSYEESGRDIRVELRPDAVIIESPGGLPEPVTEENIRETQYARNIRVLKVLRLLNLAEDRGRGVDVMIDEMAAALLDPPRFNDLGHSVRVVLPVRGVVSPQERAWVLEIERRGQILPPDRVLLVHAARGEELTNERVRDLLGMDSRDARRTLKRLTNARMLVQRGSRGGSHYVIAPSLGAPAAFRLSPAAIRRLVRSLAREGPITNAMVREATGLDRVEALRVLDALVDRGDLVRIGERRGSRYVLARSRAARTQS